MNVNLLLQLSYKGCTVLVLHAEMGSLHLGLGCHTNPPNWYQLEGIFNQRMMALLILNRGFFPVWHAWLKKYHTDFATMMAIYDGHAGRFGGQWMMCASSKHDRSVQSFVDEYDGRALLILLLTCNPRNLGRVTSRKSLVIYSRSVLTGVAMESPRSRQIMHVPGYGDFIGRTDEARLNEIAKSLEEQQEVA